MVFVAGVKFHIDTPEDGQKFIGSAPNHSTGWPYTRADQLFNEGEWPHPVIETLRPNPIAPSVA